MVVSVWLVITVTVAVDKIGQIEIQLPDGDVDVVGIDA